MADAMFREAKNTVDTYLTKVSEEKLLKEPRLQPLRKELLSLALDYYLGFIKQRADDPSVRKDLADAYIRAGDVYRGTYTGPDENVGSKRGKELRAPGHRVVRGIGAGETRGPGAAGRTGGKLGRSDGDYWVDGEYEAGLDRLVLCHSLIFG